METYESSLNQPEMLVSLHSDKEVGCVDCHSMSFEQQLHETVAYLQDDYTQPFTRAEYGMETCFQCHEHGSYDQIAWRTTDLGVTDGKTKGHEANPHQSPHYDDLECNTCHRMHRESVLFCSECHAFEFRIPVPVPSDSTDSTDSTDEPADDSVVEDSTETP
ncbi:cytochrome c3 family protein [Phototrophicus methaneseepsis]|nr:cytochrome c3 family protein [Phototrophicus methaneseepsis]